MATHTRTPTHESRRNRQVATAVAVLTLIVVTLAGSFAMTRIPSVIAPVVQTEVTIAASDRVLVVSPHPDDESIACSGLIQHALTAGAQVRVLWMTAGDHNVIGPPLFSRKAAVTPAQFRDIGHRRMKEAMTAAALLGLKPQDLIFLGYPDMGLSDIFLKMWSSQPYRSGLTNATVVPYAESVVAGQPQTAKNLLADVEHVMSSFQPTVVAYPNFIDNHPDHQATALFVTAAFADLHLAPRRLEYVVHVNGWPRPLRYAPFVDSYAPPAARILGLRQEVVHLTPAEVEVKTHAIQAHASELLPLATLVAFARRTEVFLAPADLNNNTDPEQVARFFFPVNRTGDDDRPAVQRVTVARAARQTSVALEMGRSLNGLEEMELFLFPLPGGGTFSQAPKLRVIYRGGRPTAEVTDLGQPGANPVTVPVTSKGAEVTFVVSDELAGGIPRGFFLRLERGPGPIDTARSRTVWIGIVTAVH
ncbi:MAG: PIG-L deacetylase family protein [Candidatus Cryosericum sp.]